MTCLLCGRALGLLYGGVCRGVRWPGWLSAGPCPGRGRGRFMGGSWVTPSGEAWICRSSFSRVKSPALKMMWRDVGKHRRLGRNGETQQTAFLRGKNKAAKKEREGGGSGRRTCSPRVLSHEWTSVLQPEGRADEGRSCASRSPGPWKTARPVSASFAGCCSVSGFGIV